MCQLLGLNFNVSVNPNISFNGFSLRGDERNPAGWGIGFYPDHRASQIVKEPIKSSESFLAKNIQNYHSLESKTFIAHIRYISVGDKSFNNTHPFTREYDGRDIIFAHNGTIDNFKKFKLGRFKPVGKTDSEHIFCYILGYIDTKEIKKWNNDSFEWLLELLQNINREGRLNILFSDSDNLFIYRSFTSSIGLKLLHRKSPYGTIRLLDEDYEINLNHSKRNDEHGYIVATECLTSETWEDLPQGLLTVICDGQIIFQKS